MINIKTYENHSHVEVVLLGRLTTNEAKEAFNYVQPVWQQPKIVHVNLAGVTDLDAAGFQILIYWKVQAAARQHKLSFINHSVQVLAAFEQFGRVAAAAGA